jgi:nicotinamide-nucleotide amidase
MWPAALAAEPVQHAMAGRSELRQETLRLWGTLESQLAATLRQSEWPGLEVTTCLRDGELEVVTRYGPDAQPEYDRLVEGGPGGARSAAVLRPARPSTTWWRRRSPTAG